MNYRQFIFQPLLYLFCNLAVAIADFFFAQFAQILLIRHTLRQREVRQMQMTEFKFHIAPLGYLQCVRYRLRHSGEQVRHFPSRFQIKIVIVEFHAVFIVERPARLDAQQHIMKRAVLSFYIVDIVRRHQFYTVFLRQIYQTGVGFRFFGNLVVLYFQKEIVPAENLRVFLHQFFRPLHIVADNRLRYFTGNTAA